VCGFYKFDLLSTPVRHSLKNSNRRNGESRPQWFTLRKIADVVQETSFSCSIASHDTDYSKTFNLDSLHTESGGTSN